MHLHIPYRPGGQENGGIANANALVAFLTADKKDCARCLQRIQVPAYDRHGRRFDMSLKMAQSNRSYRFFGHEWRRFVADNQLGEAMAAADELGRKLEVEL